MYFAYANIDVPGHDVEDEVHEYKEQVLSQGGDLESRVGDEAVVSCSQEQALSLPNADDTTMVDMGLHAGVATLIKRFGTEIQADCWSLS